MIKATELKIENFVKLNGFEEVLDINEIFFLMRLDFQSQKRSQSEIGRIEGIEKHQKFW